ncbi:MAG: GTP-binding protein [Fibrobacteraceae bacterium]|nr:GTP-binding protein [Fibrobacteraceae bacterium]
MKMNTLPVLLLTGYLGSGKTTLVNHILGNKQGIKFAVIVNDIGEVNIDADLIQKGGIVGKKDDSLVALQNGCICCTLKMDLVQQIEDILNMGKFDYIVIEASGICEPEPIAQTLCAVQEMSRKQFGVEVCRLDCVATVVDALRMKSEFGCGEQLTKKDIDDEDLENLVIQQIEFCNMIILNKVSEVTSAELEQLKKVIRALQPTAKIVECDYANVNMCDILNTRLFNFEHAAMSASWIQELERPLTEEEKADAMGRVHHEDEDCHEQHHHDEECDDPDCECHHHHEECDDPECECHHHEGHHHDEGHEGEHHHHDHCHCHHHHHEGGEVEEYGIGTFVYFRRPAFDREKFHDFLSKDWGRNIIRSKGICYFADEDKVSYMFEQAGVQKKLSNVGPWYCTLSDLEQQELRDQNPDLDRDWDDVYGDKMQKIVFIGQKLDKNKIIDELDNCLVK